MIKAFINRENEIFDILNEFNKQKLEYILVGGYAVSAFIHRFSIDADICINKKDLGDFSSVLKQNNFSSVKRKELNDVYKGEFESFSKKTGLPITVDLMIGSIASRQTNISFSCEFLFNNSVVKKITGIEKSTEARIPVKELLIALKIHSARLTDIRDIVALCNNIDFDKAINFTIMKKSNNLADNLNKIIEILDSENFKDSFKGVFSLEKLPMQNIKDCINMINRLKKNL